MIQKLDNEVKMLRQELAMHDTLSNRRNQSYEPLSEHQLLDIENQCRRFLEGNLGEIEVMNVRQVQATFDAFKRIYKYEVFEPTTIKGDKLIIYMCILKSCRKRR